MSINIHWFRRDLRLEDNASLYYALKSKEPVQCLFIFDKNILDELPKDDLRVTFIYNTIINLNKKLNELGTSLIVKYGKPIEVWKELIKEHDIKEVFTNRDYESYALKRDNELNETFAAKNIIFNTYKDHVIFEGNEVLKDDGKPYTVFTPYKKKWLLKFESGISNDKTFYFKPYSTQKYFKNFSFQKIKEKIPTLESMGFVKSSLDLPSQEVKQGIIKTYDQTRDIPSVLGTSRLGIHFRFGTISIRDKARKAQKLNATYLSELIWRDFYAQILYNFPHVENAAFRPEYDRIEWVNNEDDFYKWKNGNTGYPIVDAGMRELNTTGYMHNRVRMVVASFLTKHLLINWQWGEAYFAEKLIDFDLASNNGGWQWAAGCGTDAAPYFRIFSPQAQQERFDPKFIYIKKWVPEYGTSNYTLPLVDHKMARERCLQVYKRALNKD